VSSIEVRSLCVSLAGRDIVKDVSLEVPSGGWLSVIGPNGAGKTTLLRAIAGLVPSTGEVLFDGVDSRTLRARERAKLVAIVAQRPVLPEAMTVADYVLLGRTPHIAYLDTETRSDIEVAASALERLDVAGFAERPLGTLSGGEQQRVVLARALAQAAPALLLDEGTNALDVGSQQQVLEIVSELRETEGITVVSAMHDLTLASQYAETVALLGGGRVVAVGTPAEVIRPDLIAAHYRAEVHVEQTADGIIVYPVRRKAART
jgi:cobalamin transport system ATP-binding protein